MTTITLKGNEVQLQGTIIKKGDTLPAFTGVNAELQEINLEELKGQKLIINFAPSLDTPTCQKQLIEYNKKAEETDAKIIFITMDLPFAQIKFCGINSIDSALVLSDFRNRHSDNFGVIMKTGPLAGLTARAVIAVDESGVVTQVQLVPEITQEPDYSLIN